MEIEEILLNGFISFGGNSHKPITVVMVKKATGYRTFEYYFPFANTASMDIKKEFEILTGFKSEKFKKLICAIPHANNTSCEWNVAHAYFGKPNPFLLNTVDYICEVSISDAISHVSGDCRILLVIALIQLTLNFEASLLRDVKKGLLEIKTHPDFKDAITSALTYAREKKTSITYEQAQMFLL